MRLLLMRHGDAEPVASRDSQRKLTPDGRNLVAQTVQKLNVRVELIVTSPFVRARQTAQLASEHYPAAPVQVWDELVPSGSCVSVSTRLEQVDIDHVMLITHQPFVSDYVYYLTGQEVSMQTATIACVKTELVKEEWGELEWVSRG